MLRQFHALKKHEEGQALVLAAISMLVLCLCLLATVNLSYAAKERIELQNTADAAAYTTAAYQARALNFFAYTNRAMTVHYASQMNIMAVISFMGVSLLVATLLAKLFSAVPYLGEIFLIIEYIIKIYYWILDVEAALVLPIIDGINFGMSLMQTAVWTSMATRLLITPTESVQKSNPNYTLDPLDNLLLNLTPAALGVNGVVNADPTPSLGILTQTSDRNATLNRLMMTEIANSARHRWTVDGTPGPRPWIAFGIPRQFHLSAGLPPVFNVSFDRQGRTEWGSMQGSSIGGGIIGGIINGLTGGIMDPTEQIYSIERFMLKITFLGLTVGVGIDVIAHADRAALYNAVASIFGGGNAPVAVNVTNPPGPHLAWWDPRKWAVSLIDGILNAAVQAGLQELNVSFPNLPLFHFGQVPYARFIPQAHVGPQGFDSGLFNQPPVILMVTAPSTYLASRGQPFMGYFGAHLGNLTAGSTVSDGQGALTSYEATRNRSASKRGYVTSVDFHPGDTPFAFMKPGFHAMSAAMAYYHRPGDWREPPNLFNPFWGAKLMPVTDYPSMHSSPLLGAIINENLFVH